MATILLVDDDTIYLYAVGRRLRNYGYEVLPAQHGLEALKISHTWNGLIDLLCTDVKLPNMHGESFCSQIQQERPDIAHLFITGYSDVPDALVKPFTDEQLK